MIKVNSYSTSTCVAEQQTLQRQSNPSFSGVSQEVASFFHHNNLWDSCSKELNCLLNPNPDIPREFIGAILVISLPIAIAVTAVVEYFKHRAQRRDAL